MSDMQSTLGRTLLTSMIKTREKKGDITLQDVGNIFMNMAASLNPTNGVADNFVHQEIAKLAQYIGDAKNEITRTQISSRNDDAKTMSTYVAFSQVPSSHSSSSLFPRR